MKKRLKLIGTAQYPKDFMDKLKGRKPLVLIARDCKSGEDFFYLCDENDQELAFEALAGMLFFASAYTIDIVKSKEKARSMIHTVIEMGLGDK